VDIVEAVNLLAENHLIKALDLYENPIRWRENRFKMDVIQDYLDEYDTK
jgi:hypothetical protein